jgi:hypothetical protein
MNSRVVLPMKVSASPARLLVPSARRSGATLIRLAEDSGEWLTLDPVTVNIFLRELRPYWTKADPEPLPIVT